MIIVIGQWDWFATKLDWLNDLFFSSTGLGPGCSHRLHHAILAPQLAPNGKAEIPDTRRPGFKAAHGIWPSAPILHTFITCCF